jgi:hypothetical protein
MTLRLDGFTPASPISPLVVAGVCAAGKTTLAHNLELRGISARPVAQEHSRVKGLYRRAGGMVVLLVASWSTVHRRRRLAWNPAFYREEWERLMGARRDAAYVLHTDFLTPDEVADRVAGWFDHQFGFSRLWAEHPEWGSRDRAAVRARFRP